MDLLLLSSSNNRVSKDTKSRIPANTKIAAFIATFLGVAFIGDNRSLAASDIIWSSTVTGSNLSWNTAGNWQGNVVPNNTSNIAEFGAANATSLIFSNSSTTVGGIQFDSGAPAFTISNRRTLLGSTLTIDGSVTGAGIVNNSSNTQTINNSGLSSVLNINNAVVQGPERSSSAIADS